MQLPGLVSDYEELKHVFEEFHIDSDKTRFFVDYEYMFPKAFVIYFDNISGDFVVYKNKADGTRVVRYEGKDEYQAVSIFYDKFLEEYNLRYKDNLSYPGDPIYQEDEENYQKYIRRRKYKSTLFGILSVIIISTFAFYLFYTLIHKDRMVEVISPQHYEDGYYYRDDNVYYRYGDELYYYIDDAWIFYESWDDSYYNYDYYSGNYYNDYYWDYWDGYYDYVFDDGYYDSGSSNWDSDYDDWDSGSDWSSWDSGSTDWGSDW